MKIQKTKVFLLFVGLLACSPQTQGGPGAQNAPETSHFNDVARYLAGLPIENPSPEIKRATESAFYKNHVALMDTAWKSIERSSLAPMREWKKDQLPDACENRLAFYPLSGADFGNFFTMLPDCKQYLMIGLEDAGSVPEPFKLSDHELVSGMTTLQRMVGQISIRNYFWTESMKAETANRYLEGVTPAILVFAARLGLNIRNIETVRLDNDGKIVPMAPTPREGRLAVLSGIRITFRAPGDSEDRTLQFLRIRIGPDSANPDKPEGKFFKQFGDFITMFKSAEYLMHFKLGYEFRDFVLARSSKIIQDDSGIPYDKFDSKWKLKNYGEYIHPFPLLQYTPQVQPAMKEAFAKERHPLPFAFGYGFYQGQGKSNLVIARKVE
ncbi:MAG: hypothetical protein JNM27_01615 [Leptospirales bacterium]|nr:hypothetical protein [Leptospirales bacterium]